MTHAGIQSGKKHVLFKNLLFFRNPETTDQLIHNGRFAGIGIANQSSRWRVAFFSLGPFNVLRFGDFFKFSSQMTDFMVDGPPIHFQLGFTGTTVGKAGSATSLLVKSLIGSCLQARQLVLKLGNLDLNLSFAAFSSLGKDFQNQGSSVQNTDTGLISQVLQLTWRQLVIGDYRSDFFCLGQMTQLFHLAGAKVGSWVRPIQGLVQTINDFHLVGFSQGCQFFHGIFIVFLVHVKANDNYWFSTLYISVH